MDRIFKVRNNDNFMISVNLELIETLTCFKPTGGKSAKWYVRINGNDIFMTTEDVIARDVYDKIFNAWERYESSHVTLKEETEIIEVPKPKVDSPLERLDHTSRAERAVKEIIESDPEVMSAMSIDDEIMACDGFVPDDFVPDVEEVTYIGTVPGVTPGSETPEAPAIEELQKDLPEPPQKPKPILPAAPPEFVEKNIRVDGAVDHIIQSLEHLDPISRVRIKKTLQMTLQNEDAILDPSIYDDMTIEEVLMSLSKSYKTEDLDQESLILFLRNNGINVDTALLISLAMYMLEHEIDKVISFY